MFTPRLFKSIRTIFERGQARPRDIRLRILEESNYCETVVAKGDKK